jgi:hypothetical protein
LKRNQREQVRRAEGTAVLGEAHANRNALASCRRGVVHVDQEDGRAGIEALREVSLHAWIEGPRELQERPRGRRKPQRIPLEHRPHLLDERRGIGVREAPEVGVAVRIEARVVGEAHHVGGRAADGERRHDGAERERAAPAHL